MTTDIRYALEQLRPLVGKDALLLADNLRHNGMSKTDMADRVVRALDALQRALEATGEAEARLEALEGAEAPEAVSEPPGSFEDMVREALDRR